MASCLLIFSRPAKPIFWSTLLVTTFVSFRHAIRDVELASILTENSTDAFILFQISTNDRIVSAPIIKSCCLPNTRSIFHQEAIDTYRNTIDLAEKKSQSRRFVLSSNNQTCLKVDVNRVLKCLRLTTPTVSLEYPNDAEQHFNDIRKAMAPWAQHTRHTMHTAAGYSGPWIENHWISHFETLYDSDNNRNSCLSDHFGPFIPLFLPWVDHWVEAGSRYPKGYLDTLLSVLRPTVPYVTVSQNAEGLTGRRNEFDVKKWPNILILSAGGYGHVPIPLLKQEEAQNNYKSIEDRTNAVSYVGSLTNAPGEMRQRLNSHLVNAHNSSIFRYSYHWGNDWRQVMADSRYSLAPRGYGRTSYHLMETLQMGLVPIHVFLDEPWVPYKALFSKVGFVTAAHRVEGLFEQLNSTSADEIRERERRIVALRTSHFTFNGTLAQIARFLKGEASDLQCQRMPRSTRSAVFTVSV